MALTAEEQAAADVIVDVVRGRFDAPLPQIQIAGGIALGASVQRGLLRLHYKGGRTVLTSPEARKLRDVLNYMFPPDSE